MWRRRRIAGLALALLFATPACVTDKPPEPGVRALTTNLQYQAIRENAAPPPNTVPGAPLPPPAPAGAPGDANRAPARTFAPPTLAPIGGVGPIAPPKSACPTATPTEQADEEVPTRVTKLPKSGKYVWVVDGHELVGAQKARFSFAKFHKRSIEAVKGTVGKTPDDASDVTFQTVEEQLSQSNAKPPVVRQFFHVTEAGVFLTKIEQLVPGEADPQVFEPLEPVPYLNIPVLAGPDHVWEATAIDLLSEAQPQILTHSAFVQGRMTIDACGERIRAWRVIAKQVFQVGTAEVTRRYHYAIATHLGGLIVFEHVESPCDEYDPTKKEAACTPKPDLVFNATVGKLEENR